MKSRWLELKKRMWDGRSASDKRALRIAATVLVPVLGWLLLWQPAHTATEKLNIEVPKLRAQAAQMQAQSEEAQALRHAPHLARLDAIALKTAIEESAMRHQLREALATIEAQQPNGVRITLVAVSFEQWLGWLRNLQQEQHIRAESVAITALPQAGMVRINASLTNGSSR